MEVVLTVYSLVGEAKLDENTLETIAQSEPSIPVDCHVTAIFPSLSSTTDGSVWFPDVVAFAMISLLWAVPDESYFLIIIDPLSPSWPTEFQVTMKPQSDVDII